MAPAKYISFLTTDPNIFPGSLSPNHSSAFVRAVKVVENSRCKPPSSTASPAESKNGSNLSNAHHPDCTPVLLSYPVADAASNITNTHSKPTDPTLSLSDIAFSFSDALTYATDILFRSVLGDCEKYNLLFSKDLEDRFKCLGACFPVESYLGAEAWRRVCHTPSRSYVGVEVIFSMFRMMWDTLFVRWRAQEAPRTDATPNKILSPAEVNLRWTKCEKHWATTLRSRLVDVGVRFPNTSVTVHFALFNNQNTNKNKILMWRSQDIIQSFLSLCPHTGHREHQTDPCRFQDHHLMMRLYKADKIKSEELFAVFQEKPFFLSTGQSLNFPKQEKWFKNSCFYPRILEHGDERSSAWTTEQVLTAFNLISQAHEYPKALVDSINKSILAVERNKDDRLKVWKHLWDLSSSHHSSSGSGARKRRQATPHSNRPRKIVRVHPQTPTDSELSISDQKTRDPTTNLQREEVLTQREGDRMAAVFTKGIEFMKYIMHAAVISPSVSLEEKRVAKEVLGELEMHRG